MWFLDVVCGSGLLRGRWGRLSCNEHSASTAPTLFSCLLSGPDSEGPDFDGPDYDSPNFDDMSISAILPGEYWLRRLRIANEEHYARNSYNKNKN